MSRRLFYVILISGITCGSVVIIQATETREKAPRKSLPSLRRQSTWLYRLSFTSSVGCLYSHRQGFRTTKCPHSQCRRFQKDQVIGFRYLAGGALLHLRARLPPAASSSSLPAPSPLPPPASQRPEAAGPNVRVCARPWRSLSESFCTVMASLTQSG